MDWRRCHSYTPTAMALVLHGCLCQPEEAAVVLQEPKLRTPAMQLVRVLMPVAEPWLHGWDPVELCLLWAPSADSCTSSAQFPECFHGAVQALSWARLRTASCELTCCCLSCLSRRCASDPARCWSSLPGSSGLLPGARLLVPLCLA